MTTTLVGRASRFVVTCKRNDASRQRRKLTKREEVREVERARIERKAQADLDAKRRPPAPRTAPMSEREATERVEEAYIELAEASEVLRERKARARGSAADCHYIGRHQDRSVAQCSQGMTNLLGK